MGYKHSQHVTPKLTVDIIINRGSDGIVLISRKFEPFGWALPGGFVDIGETTMEAAIREAKEETSLDIEDVVQFHTYSSPERDPRGHGVTVVYLANAKGTPRAEDDAIDIIIWNPKRLELLEKSLCFDHQQIVEDYLYFSKTGMRPTRE